MCAVSKVPLYTLAHLSMYMLVFMSGLVYTLVSVCPLTLCECSMERLRNLGIDPNVPKTDFISLLSNQSTDVLLNLRQSFFDDLVSDGLGNEGDELVGCRGSGRV